MQFWRWFLSDVADSITHMFEIVREGQADVENTNPAPGAPGAAALQDPLDVEAARVAEMVEQAQSRFDGMLFTATPTQDLDAVTACQHLANQAFALMLRTLTALTNRAGSDEREEVPDEIALALNVSSGTGWSLQHLAVQACELPGLVEAVEANQLGDRVQTVQRAADATYLAVRAESRVIARADFYLRGGTAQVEEVLTDPGHRGQGHASTLVHHALHLARRRGAEVVFLLAEADNWPQQLYRRLGFTDTARTSQFSR